MGSAVNHPVRVPFCNGDRAARRQAAARLVPARACVMGDRERRAAVEDGDDGRALGRRRDEQRQLDPRLRRFREFGARDEVDDLLRLGVDGVDALAGLGRDVHRELASSRWTSRVARSAACRGPRPRPRSTT